MRFLCLCSISIYAISASAQPLIKQQQYEVLAATFVESLRQGKADQDRTIFSNALNEALAAFDINRVWLQLEQNLGEFHSITRFVHQQTDKHHIVLVVAKFHQRQIALRVVFDQESKIAGFQVVEAPPLAYSPPPSYAISELFLEEEYLFDMGDIVLPGTISWPKGNAPFAVVILVHGSGPQDIDQTIGPNKPFRDLAQGLASQGLAVVRYEKRTRSHPSSININTITPWEETGSDALKIAAIMGRHHRIDKQRIFVLGHSLGGMMAPLIAQKSPNLAGIIILGGNSGKLYDLVVQQLEYLAPIQDSENRHGMKQLIELSRQQADRLRAENLPLDTPRSETMLNLPPSYWNFIRNYNQIEVASSLEMPILILQGERDYQVPTSESKKWKTGLQHLSNVTFISYPELNHLFMAGEGPSKPDEYNIPGNVDVRVINDIARWVHSR